MPVPLKTMWKVEDGFTGWPAKGQWPHHSLGPLQLQQGVPRDLNLEALRLSLDRCLKFTGETCVENRVGKEASWPGGLIEH